MGGKPTTRPATRSQIAKRRERFIELCEAFPDVRVEGGQHLSLFVGKKRFGYYLDDHHGDGRIAANLRAPLGDQDELVELDPEQYHVPAYVGSKGWIGIWLDLARVDWKALRRRVESAYRMTATKKQLALLDGSG